MNLSTTDLVDIAREYEDRLRELENRDRANTEQLRTAWHDLDLRRREGEELADALGALLGVIEASSEELAGALGAVLGVEASSVVEMIPEAVKARELLKARHERLNPLPTYRVNVPEGGYYIVRDAEGREVDRYPRKKDDE